MFIHWFQSLCPRGKSIQVTLPRPGLKLDPRVSAVGFPGYRHLCEFHCNYHEDGITVTLTRFDEAYDGMRCCRFAGRAFSMRVYDPKMENMPNFHSYKYGYEYPTTYTYMGLDGERAPCNITEVFIHPSVTIIKHHAFCGCIKMRRCIMHNDIKVIEPNAFTGCIALDALFLPSKLEKIDMYAFYGCANIRVLSIPPSIDVNCIGDDIVEDCDAFFQITQIRVAVPVHPYQNLNAKNKNQHASTSVSASETPSLAIEMDSKVTNVNEAIVNHHRNLPPLYRTCLDINVTAKSIQDCVKTHGLIASGAFGTAYGGGMTPMHILALNPHATTGAILACFHANMIAIFEPYQSDNSTGTSTCIKRGHDGQNDEENITMMSGKTPLDYLANYNLDCYLSVMAALCIYREAPTRQQQCSA